MSQLTRLVLRTITLLNGGRLTSNQQRIKKESILSQFWMHRLVHEVAAEVYEVHALTVYLTHHNTVQVQFDIHYIPHTNPSLTPTDAILVQL